MLLLATLLIAIAAVFVVARSKPRPVTIGFWFDPISSSTTDTLPEKFGSGITGPDMDVVESVAREEVSIAFRDFPVSMTDSRRATYRVRVVENLRHPMSPRMPPPSGESRAIAGLGGMGAVNFRVLAHNAIAFAPPEADRQVMLEAIGRGVGRAAVHELAHQLLGQAPIHDSTDIQSYEYRSADRREQYYGVMRWDIAGPLLQKRFGINRTPGE